MGKGTVGPKKERKSSFAQAVVKHRRTQKYYSKLLKGGFPRDPGQNLQRWEMQHCRRLKPENYVATGMNGASYDDGRLSQNISGHGETAMLVY